MEISFVIPCYNEAGNIIPLYEEIRSTFQADTASYEFVFVNDGSSDRTKEELKELSDKADEAITCVHFSRNFGKEAAIYAGLSHASGEFTCLIDADLQHPPAVALEMYRKLKENPELDCVAAYQKDRKESALLRFYKKTFYRMINGLSEVEFFPAASDFRVFRKNVREAVLSMKEYYRFTKGIFAFVGFETEYMPYEVRERLNGKSKWSFFKLFNYAVEGIVGYSTKPLRFATVLGAVFSFASVLLLLTLLVLAIVQAAFPEVLLTIGVIVLVGGLLMIEIGILGEYLMRTYMQGKDRPVYIVKEVWKGKD